MLFSINFINYRGETGNAPVKDYIESQGIVTKSEIKKLYDDEDFKKCQYLCNKGKHLNKRGKGKKTNAKTQNKFKTEVFEDTIGGAPLGELMLNEDDKYVIYSDSLTVDVKMLGKSILKKWEDFFKRNSI